MQIISNIALISINETAIVQLISFLLFLFIINRIMFQPLRKGMDERDSHIQNIQQETIDAEKEVETITSQLEDRRSAIKDEAFEFNKEVEASGQKQAAEILAAAKKEISTMKAKSEEEINAQIVEAQKHIKKETDILVVDIIEQVLNRRPVP